MIKKLLLTMIAVSLFCSIGAVPSYGEERGDYKIGVDDILEIAVLRPDPISAQVTVAPDGLITFPYIGAIQVKGLTLKQAQGIVRYKLADGFMKYPVVTVSLVESRSRRFFVYGEVIRPSSYQLTEDTTVLKAISIAGGFSKFGSASKVKVLRPKKDKPGYDAIQVNVKDVMNGNSDADLLLEQGDIVVVSEGVF